MAHFLYFSADDSKKVVTVLAKDLSALERYWVFSKNCMVNSLWSYCLPDIGGRNIKKTDESKKKMKSCFFRSLHVINGCSEPNNTLHFFK